MKNESAKSTIMPLSADAPLEDPSKDAFAYAPFAQYIAKALLAMTPAEGFVIAIHGPWGFGKTTLLNFVRCYLTEAPEEQRPLIVSFNPWWFAGSEDLVGRFFGQLSVEFNKWGRRFRKLGNGIADLGNVVADSPIPYGGVAKALHVSCAGFRGHHP